MSSFSPSIAHRQSWLSHHLSIRVHIRGCLPEGFGAGGAGGQWQRRLFFKETVVTFCAHSLSCKSQKIDTRRMSVE